MKSCTAAAPLALLSLFAACGDATPEPVAPVVARPAASPALAPQPVPARPPFAFENPGGMWMPHQMPAHADTLRKLGLELDPKELAEPTSSVLGAVVSLGGCSASFISKEGLLATNHHCATGALTHSSTPKANLVEDGYLARTRGDEKSNGPQARVYVTQKVVDVTASVTAGLSAVKDDAARFKQVEDRQKELVRVCETDKSGARKNGVRCSVISSYEGGAFHLFEYLEIRDVRLVWAPPAGVGNFGGEIDNWRWPRHTGDVSFFRAYVGRNGEAADYSPDNVPYTPPKVLRVATAPLSEGDLVFVAGYPGRTSLLKSKPEVDDAVGWSYPRRQRLCEDYLAALEVVRKGSKDAEIRATPLVRRFGNQLTNTKGQLEGLVKGGLAEAKAVEEAELSRWVDADPARKAKYRPALDGIAAALAERAKTREADAALADELGLPRLLSAVTAIVRMAEERPKKDSDREPGYQERDFARLEEAQKALATAYERSVDEALLVTALERMARLPERERSAAYALVLGKGKAPLARDAIAKKVHALYAGTKLEDEKLRLELLKSATPAKLRASADPLLKLAVALRPLLRDAEERSKRFSGRMLSYKPLWVEALSAMRAARGGARAIAPDANGTLRITFGTVRGYAPAKGAATLPAFTKLGEVLAKNKGEKPFDVPASLVAAAKAQRFEGYVDRRLGEVPVDFVSDLHITGGNSGSATLNARGELVGLAFDGNYEAMASDWVFVPEVTRSIHVDFRYVAWLLDAVEGAGHLLREVGLTPRYAK